MKNLNKLKQTVKARLAPHRITMKDHTQSELLETLGQLYDDMEKNYTSKEISSAIQEEMTNQILENMEKFKKLGLIK